MKLLIGISLLLSLSSCEKLLDINPVAEIVGSEIFETAQGCEDALYGVYGTLAGTSMYGRNMAWGITEVLAQHFRDNNKELEQLAKYNYEVPQVADRLSNIWSNGYQAIGYTNNIIINLERIGENAHPLSRVYLGEAYALRAMLHFDLLRLFASRYEGNQNKQGIPYVTTYAFVQTSFFTIGECYEKIIADFTKAQGYLEIDESITYPSQGGSTEKKKFLQNRQGHLNYYAVTGLLARVLWSKNDLPGALTEALKVIGSKKFSLLKRADEVEKMLTKSFNIQETLFGLASKEFFVAAKDVFYTSGENSGFTLLQLDTKSLYPYEDIYTRDLAADEGNDYRNGWFKLLEGSAVVKKCWKLASKGTVDGSESGLLNAIEGGAVIRLPEMYYIVAEARLAGSDLPGAMAAIDSVLITRGLKGLAERSGVPLTEDFIYNERQKEFFCEGLRWFDMKKRNEDIKSNTEYKVIPASDKIYRFPIPAAETNNRFQ